MGQPWLKYSSQQDSSSESGPWMKYAQAATAPTGDNQIKEIPPTELESAARGAAQGGTLGFADEALGALGALGSKYVNPQASLLEEYRRIRDEQRVKDEKAKETNPTSYALGNAGGAIGSAFIPGMNALTGAKGVQTFGQAAKAGAKLGALAGLGQSQADLTEGDLSGAAEDTAVGAGIGAATGGITHGALEALKGFHPINAAKNLARVAFNTPEEVTQAYIDNPEAVKNALPRYELAKKFEDAIGDLKNQVTQGSQGARQYLNDVPVRGSEIREALNPITQGLEQRSEGVWDDSGRKASYDMLKGLQDKFNPQIPSSGNANEDLLNSLQQKSYTGNRLKDLVQSLQRATQYDQQPGQFTSVDQGITKDAAAKLNELLKNKSPEYAQEMQKVAKDTGLLGQVADIDKSPAAMANLFRKMETDKYGGAQIPREVVQNFDQRMGTDFLDQMRNSLAKETLDKSTMNGSRNVNFYSNTLGQIPGGKLLGPILGGTVDKYGNRMTQSAVDAAIKFNQLAKTQGVQATRELLQPIINAAQKADPSAILTLQLLDKSNPDLLKKDNGE
jgi:hypothetical protein